MEDPDAYSRTCAPAGAASNLSSPGAAIAIHAHYPRRSLHFTRARGISRTAQYETISAPCGSWKRGIVTVEEVELDALNAYRAYRPISSRTWLKALEILRHFFRHCVDNEWAAESR